MKATYVRELINAIRRQNDIGPTTIALCANTPACRNAARGGGECVRCLSAKLKTLGCDPSLVDTFVESTRHAAECYALLIDACEDG